MKQVYQSNDGKIFESKSECITHEQKSDLTGLVLAHSNSQYNWNVSDVVTFIQGNIEQINDILGYSKLKWIKNCGTNPKHPESINGGDLIIIKMNSGSFDAGHANDWGASWVGNIAEYAVIESTPE